MLFYRLLSIVNLIVTTIDYFTNIHNLQQPVPTHDIVKHFQLYLGKLDTEAKA